MSGFAVHSHSAYKTQLMVRLANPGQQIEASISALIRSVSHKCIMATTLGLTVGLSCTYSIIDPCDAVSSGIETCSQAGTLGCNIGAKMHL